ncbi:NADH dehydrogenase [ubiquinone] 1 beta subcomplex subunit 11-like protein [Leptotrombidium deliense]|uniref:NADH dehydrogenase [ubiquinone] 1 beta subcomplex subunit 11, mitochondrial n=1 Tax=Leptotrombidium deliense TaxID=299467 RepID=A0A443SNE2_9ACAR|nr:NADH dehydrogenase [ubiquinone] 1 beta subcomplex subunit 11-like protein [Leptotrombidium deliense]
MLCFGRRFAKCTFNRRLVAPICSPCLRTIKTGDGPKKGGDHWEIAPGDPKHGGDGDIFLHPGGQKRPPGPKTVEEFVDVDNQKNWVSYGFDFLDYRSDRRDFHMFHFSIVTLIFTLGAYIWFHYPDWQQFEWAHREAYLELYRREKLGLPLVDKNLIDPSKIYLPTEEQLGDYPVYL